MQRCALLFLLLLASCAGRQGQPSAISDADGIDIPWGESQAAPTRITDPPQVCSEPDVAQSQAPRGKQGVVIDFEVKNSDLHDAFRLLAETAGINIVVADSVQGRISLRLQQVGWRQVLETIAKTEHLTLQQEGDIYYVR